MGLAAKWKSALGLLLLDLPRYGRRLWLPGGDDLAICNRGESLESGPQGRGYRCSWPWTSDLRAPAAWPALGRSLMRKSLSRHPIGSAASVGQVEAPHVSFVIGHRGEARLPHLLATLESIAAQRGVAIECIVVEQASSATLAPSLPPWVNYVHTPLPRADLPYCRSWALNVGSRHARGKVLVLHDNDMLVPMDYAAHALALVRQEYEVINLKRFVFYLSPAHTARWFAGARELVSAAPQAIVQNLQAGGSIAITRDAFDAIGGMDESFVGWGGEDNEFWERAATRRVWPWGFLPLVHLWHEAQAGKQRADNPTMQLYRTRSATPPQARIDALHRTARGGMRGPAAGEPA